ncbi:tetratricopeptide repeat protein [Nibrella viscosa]
MPIRSLTIIYCTVLILSACTSSDQYVNQARTLLQQGKPREAIQILNKAIEADDDNVEAFNMRGVAYFDLKEYANAQLDYEQAIKLKPNFYRPYYNRALLRTAQSDNDAALKDYSEAIRLAPDTSRSVSAEIYLNRGQLFAAQQQTLAALNDFTKAIELNPRNALALYNRGNLLFQQKQLEPAVADFQRAVEADPKFGKAFYGLGIAQVLLNQRESGCLSLKQARQLGYNDADAAVGEFCE